MSLADVTNSMLQEFVKGLPDADREIIEKAFQEIAQSNWDADALAEGDKAEDFSLANAKGEETRLSSLLANGPVILNFYRGDWCPYCNLEFKALNDILPQIKDLGATLVGISPELPDNSLNTKEKHQLQFQVLSDVGNVVARLYGIVMPVPEIMRPLYDKWGIDLHQANGDHSWELPIPATYVLSPDATVIAAYVNKNYTQRMEPTEIVRLLDNGS